jgi:UDP-N-acetylglucosamine--dolichyl-phosphate N-acetylglucosaminephosphotransferase
MALLSIFSSNSINILAGINGIEVAQSVVIAVLIAGNDMLYLSPFTTYPHPATDSHLFSLYFLLPFIGVSLALLKHNWFPAKVFVGDTYCYFAGMVFAVVAILGHFSKTLILLLLPQAFNFAYSVPQVFHIIPCPRHRLPHFNARTGLLEPSRVQFQRPLRRPIAESLKALHRLRLLDVEVDDKGQVLSSTCGWCGSAPCGRIGWRWGYWRSSSRLECWGCSFDIAWLCSSSRRTIGRRSN